MDVSRKIEFGRVALRVSPNLSETDISNCRQHLTNLMNGAELYPRHMPPYAILIVRRMRDPAPGRLAPWRAGPRMDRLWESAARDAIEDVFARAVRPDRGHIDPNAQAVRFTDRSEMLACLAFDIVAGEVWAKWWWRSILKNMPSTTPDLLALLMRKEAIYIPAALTLLYEWKMAVTVVQALSPALAQAVVSAMCNAFDLPDFNISIDAPERTRIIAASSIENITPEKKASNIVDSFEQPASGNKLEVKPPWGVFLPHAHIPKDLKKENAALLGLGLLIQSGSPWVRRPEFYHLFRTWRRIEQQHRLNPKTIRSEKRTSEPIFAKTKQDSKPEKIKPAAPRNAGVFNETKKKVVHRLQQETKTAVHRSQQETKAVNQADGTQTNAHPDLLFRTERAPVPDVKSRRPVSRQDRIRPVVMDDHSVAGTKSLPVFEHGVKTHLAGAFYLINLMKDPELSDYFEADQGIAGKTGAWGLLEVIARGLPGPGNDDMASDPLWDAFAELDGRAPGVLPQMGFNFALPKRSSINGKDGGPAAEGPYSHRMIAHSFTGRLVKGLGPNIIRWMATVLPKIRRRLQTVLNIQGPDQADVGRTLMWFSGKLYVTATHVDLVMSLEDISIPVRLAGLDRNPGWAPDYGRVIQFYFQ